jgi:hypothetical protein
MSSPASCDAGGESGRLGRNEGGGLTDLAELRSEDDNAGEAGAGGRSRRPTGTDRSDL